MFIAANAVPAAAQGTQAQREACMDDAFRLCAASIPDPVRIEACLKQNRRSLSIACTREVFGDDAPLSRRETPAVEPVARGVTY
jgi:hypothetical protein